MFILGDSLYIIVPKHNKHYLMMLNILFSDLSYSLLENECCDRCRELTVLNDRDMCACS